MRDVKKLLEAMPTKERAQLLEWTARDLPDSYPRIETTPGVWRGGLPCRNPYPRLDFRAVPSLRGERRRTLALLSGLAGRGPRSCVDLCPLPSK